MPFGAVVGAPRMARYRERGVAGMGFVTQIRLIGNYVGLVGPIKAPSNYPIASGNYRKWSYGIDDKSS